MRWCRRRLCVPFYFFTFTSVHIRIKFPGNNANCNTAFHSPTDTFVQVACQTNNVSFTLLHNFTLLLIIMDW